MNLSASLRGHESSTLAGRQAFVMLRARSGVVVFQPRGSLPVPRAVLLGTLELLVAESTARADINGNERVSFPELVAGA